MNIGVLYFNRGTSCYARLITSVYSLRRRYPGPVALMQEGSLEPWVSELLENLGVRIQLLPEPQEKVLLKKTSLWRDMPFDKAMFLDADTLVRSSVDEYLEWVANWDYVATWFSGWPTDNRQMRGRISEWSRVCPELVAPALAYGKAINTGVQGLSKTSTLLPAHEELARRGDAAGCNRLVLDELAIQLLLPRHTHFLADHSWNTSGSFGDVQKAKVIHYHGRKHCLIDNPRCDLWKDCYFEVLASFPGMKAHLTEASGDQSLRAFVTGMDETRRDLTVVTAVDPAYAGALERNLPAWLELPGLRNQRFLVFVSGFHRPEEIRFLDHPNVKVIPWEYPHVSAGRREFMLASFILGVARHVSTPFWMKLDADCSPQRRWWRWPNYMNYAVVSHPWTYTRIKGDTDMTRHWFNRLDDLFKPDIPFFERVYGLSDVKVSHRAGNPDGLPLRFNSFCHIERTDFTRRIASVLEQQGHGRMPIPSQDTIVWYCTQIWREKVMFYNMREWFKN